MTDGPYHLAQANIALSIAPLTDPIMAGFAEQLDYINAVADASAGFVWRLQSDEGNATAIRAFEDPLIIFNMSVWESVAALYDYVFRSDHRGPLKDRRSWFRKLEGPHSVMWWIAAGDVPSIEDAKGRLDVLAAGGPGPEAFTYGRLFDPQGRPMKLDARRDEGCGV